MKSEGQNPPKGVVFNSSTELGKRISAVLALHESRQSAAAIGEVSTDQLSKYEKGAASPRWETLVRLAKAKGVSLEWLASGEGEMLPSPAKGGDAPPAACDSADPDLVLLENVVAGLEKFLDEDDLELRPDGHARVITVLYGHMMRQRKAFSEIAELAPAYTERGRWVDPRSIPLVADILRAVAR